ncbi:MAG: molybdate ABC transporter substrate-binding protein [Thiotrichales bacterium]|nr:molybdate ABC transporter substrate-binding protein [Thiotrichales bacterium]
MLVLFPTAISAVETTVVAVSANMARSIAGIQNLFEKHHGHQIRFSVASSGTLTYQIIHGAPYSAFLSADHEYIRQLLAAGVTTDKGIHYASGRICFYLPGKSGLYQQERLEDLISRLSHDGFQRFAMANPLHAPYGKAAKTALQRAGIWAMDRNKLVIGENIAQVMQFARSGSVDAAIVAYSHYLADRDTDTGKCLLIPDYWHNSIDQYMILLDKTDTVAAEFLLFMRSEQVKALLSGHGYKVP